MVNIALGPHGFDASYMARPTYALPSNPLAHLHETGSVYHVSLGLPFGLLELGVSAPARICRFVEKVSICPVRRRGRRAMCRSAGSDVSFSPYAAAPP